MNNKFLETKNITKTFGKLKALDDVNFNLYRGKIHGLLGENGAGKSSLMNVLSGIYKPEKGIIYLDGQRQNISSPDIASQLGIGMVHQEFRLVESFSIKDNLTLSKSNIFKDNFLKSFKKYSEIFALNANIMLLDEPTAVLTPQETSQLKNSLITLAEEDMKTIVLITHKLKEIKEFTEIVSVMKNGKMVAKDLPTNDVTDNQLIELMMGEVKKSTINKDNEIGQTKLKVENINFFDSISNIKKLEEINFQIKAGEILGLAGVSGNGQVELANIISGIERIFEGKIIINNNDVSKKGVRSRKKLNLSYIPENRLGVGLAPGVSVIDNSIVRDYFFTKLGPHISKSRTSNYLQSLIKQFSIKAPNPKAEISTLSGGNMQKLLMGRELVGNPDVIIASQPTRGLDVNAVDAIHNLLIDQRNKGSAIFLISEDLDELFKLSHRLLVIFEGKIVKSFNTVDANINDIGLAMAGVSE